jgi:hypothetical protein
MFKLINNMYINNTTLVVGGLIEYVEKSNALHQQPLTKYALDLMFASRLCAHCTGRLCAFVFASGRSSECAHKGWWTKK